MATTKFVSAPVINDVQELASLNLKRGQWIKLAWCDRPSRFDHLRKDASGRVTYVCAYHYPRASTIYWTEARKLSVRPLAIR